MYARNGAGALAQLHYERKVHRTITAHRGIERLLEACRERGIVAERLFGEREILIGWCQALEYVLPGLCCQ